MRKVKNNISNTSNPSLLFARGIESMIADPMHSPAQYDEQEISKLRRVANNQDGRGNLFSTLFRQFSNY